jgi:hypothetical protein
MCREREHSVGPFIARLAGVTRLDGPRSTEIHHELPTRSLF